MSGPLVVGVSDLLRHPGSRREIAAEVRSGGITVAEVEVVTGAAIRAELCLEALSDSLVVTGTVTSPWRGPCRRCLEPVEGTLTAELREVFEPDPVEGETWPLLGDTVDLAPMVREAVVLALPLAPLCSPDCPGPDPERFPAVVGREEGAPGRDEDAEAPRDPRWAALEELRFDR